MHTEQLMIEGETAVDRSATVLIDRILASGRVEDAEGKSIPLRGGISRSEANFLRGLIAADPSIARTLEIGCAFGLSSLAICGSTAGRPGAHHVALDPNQSRDWFGIGLRNLRRAGLSHFEVLERRSEVELPARAASEPGSFDLVFIDGFHTFDHTMIDAFFANRLLRVGGLLVIDDCSLPSVAKAVSYLKTYPCYRLEGQADPDRPLARHRLAALSRSLVPVGMRQMLPMALHDLLERARHGSMVALRKVEEDRRRWNWHRPW